LHMMTMPSARIAAKSTQIKPKLISLRRLSGLSVRKTCTDERSACCKAAHFSTGSVPQATAEAPSPPTVRKDRTGVAGARFRAIEVIGIALLLLNADVFGYQRWCRAVSKLDLPQYERSLNYHLQAHDVACVGTFQVLWVFGSAAKSATRDETDEHRSGLRFERNK
jgi:hypothetical protein